MVRHEPRGDTQAEEVVEADQPLQGLQAVAAVVPGMKRAGRARPVADLEQPDVLRLERLIAARDGPATRQHSAERVREPFGRGGQDVQPAAVQYLGVQLVAGEEEPPRKGGVEVAARTLEGCGLATGALLGRQTYGHQALSLPSSSTSGKSCHWISAGSRSKGLNMSFHQYATSVSMRSDLPPARVFSISALRVLRAGLRRGPNSDSRYSVGMRGAVSSKPPSSASRDRPMGGM